MGQEESVRKFPVELLNWAGHRGGGVKRLFYTKSGRPSGEIIHTRLLTRLGEWATAIPSAVLGSPRVVLLVGGPGNGKTEAVEFTIHSIDAALGLSGVLVQNLILCEFSWEALL